MRVEPEKVYSYDSCGPASAGNSTPKSGGVNQNAYSNTNSHTSENDLQTVGYTKGLETFPKDKYSSSDWVEIKPTQDKFLWMKTGGYTFTSSNGTKIQLDDITGVVVKENKQTGEIVVAGAVNAKITSGGGDINLTVYDSDISTITTKRGNDKINLFNTEVDSINSGDGNDSINIENSTVKGKVEGGGGDDYIHSKNSTVGTLSGSAGNDSFLVENSQVKSITGGKGDDTIIVSQKSTVDDLKGDKGNDTINITDSTVKSTDATKGKDNVYIDNSDTDVKEEKKGGTTVNRSKGIPETTAADTIKAGKETVEQATSVTDKKTAEYNHDLTPEEQVYAIAVSFFEDNLNNMIADFDAQEKADGILRDGYNWVKELTDLGVSKADIKKALEEQQQMITEMKNAINGKGKESFKDVFKRWTGVEYSEENMTKCLESSQMYSLAATGFKKASAFESGLKNVKNMEEALALYTQYYGDEKTGKEKFLEFLNETLTSGGADYDGFNSVTGVGFIKNITLTNDNKLVLERMEGRKEEVALSDAVNFFKDFYWIYDDLLPGKYQEDFKNNFENVTGTSIEQLQNEYASNQLKALGRGTSFQKLIDRYSADQKGFADKVSSAMQISGMGLMAAGGVVCIVCPPAAGVGVGLMEAGKYTAIAGTFVDNGIEILDKMSSEDGLSKEAVWKEVKEGIQELALLYSGAKINGVAAGAKDFVLSETQNKALAFLAQIGTDASLSLLSDFMITGDVSLTSEGISQLMGIITGLAGAKVNQYTNESFEAADKMYNNNDVNGAVEYLKKRGISESAIHDHYKAVEFDKINENFKKTGDVAQALKMLSESKILNESDIRGLSSELKLQALSKNGIDISKYKGYDFNSSQGKLVAGDIDMYYKALTQGVNVNDLMVPKASSIEVGLRQAKIGDVFEIEGSNKLCLKTGDGTYQEINLSKDAYCRLFPALERYTSGQNASGDCYLVSVLNSMMADGNTRELLLNCFSEAPDGTITVKMPNSQTEIEIKPGQTIKDLGVNTSKAMSGSLGMQLLEYAYKVDLVNNELGDFNGKVDKLNQQMLDVYNDYMELTKLDKAYSGYDIEYREITFEEFKAFAESEYKKAASKIDSVMGRKMDAEKTQQIIEMFDYIEGVFASGGKLTDRGINYLSKATGIPASDTEKLNKIYTEIASEIKKNPLILGEYQKLKGYASEISDLEAARDAVIKGDLAKAAEKAGGNGGHSSDAFRAFGMQAEYQSVETSWLLDELIKNPDLQDKYVITAGTKESKMGIIEDYFNPKSSMYKYYHDHPGSFKEALKKGTLTRPKGIYTTHAYSFEVRKNATTGEIEIVVTNPWSVSGTGASKELVLTVEEFKENFSSIYIGTK